MQKVYYLLRSNQEMGPFPVDELLQRMLPNDLVWIEGESFTWSYPGEVEELKSILDPGQVVLQEKQENKKVDDIESRAEELRHKLVSFKPRYCFTTTFTNDRIYLGASNRIESSKNASGNKRKKEVPLYEWFSGVMVMLMVVAGVYGGQRYLGAKSRILPGNVTQQVAVDHHAAKAPRHSNPLPVAYKAPPRDTMVRTIALTKNTADLKAKKTKAVKAALAKILKEVKAPVKNEEVLLPVVEDRKLDSPKEALVPPVLTTIQPVEKKKSLGQVFKGLFRKKKKVDEKSTAQEGAPPVQTQDN
ncbi:MAG: hypothetical protein ACXVBR_01470 [Flavisolibacter sp.]